MSSPIPISLVPVSFPNGYCPGSWQTLANDLANGMTATVAAGNNFFNFGNTQPAVGAQNMPWLRTFNDGSPDKWYVYASGAWVSRHDVPPSSSERRLWIGLESDLITYDGGQAGGVSDTTGPMWQVDHAFDARFPVGPGTLPSTTAIAPLGTGGEENHTLLLAEEPPHFHGVAGYGFSIGDDTEAQMISRNWSGVTTFATKMDAGDGARSMFASGNITSGPFATANQSADVSVATTPHNNMPPYIGAFFIKRTARKFYVPQ